MAFKTCLILFDLQEHNILSPFSSLGGLPVVLVVFRNKARQATCEKEEPASNLLPLAVHARPQSWHHQGGGKVKEVCGLWERLGM